MSTADRTVAQLADAIRAALPARQRAQFDDDEALDVAFDGGWHRKYWM